MIGILRNVHPLFEISYGSLVTHSHHVPEKLIGQSFSSFLNFDSDWLYPRSQVGVMSYCDRFFACQGCESGQTRIAESHNHHIVNPSLSLSLILKFFISRTSFTSWVRQRQLPFTILIQGCLQDCLQGCLLYNFPPFSLSCISTH